MRRIEGHFEKLFTTDSLLGKGQVNGNVLIVPFRQVCPLRGHPMTDTTLDHFSGRMIFEGVVSSVRTVSEYAGDPHETGEGFDPRQEADGPFPNPEDADVREFAFEGRQEAPWAWVDWVVHARRFVLEVDE